MDNTKMKEILATLAPYGINVVRKYSEQNDLIFTIIIPKDSKVKRSNRYVRGDAATRFATDVIDKNIEGSFGIEFIEDQIKEAINVGKEKNVRLYCGEFGVIDQAPLEDTLRWFDDVFTVFEKYNIGYSIWTYKEKDFGLIDEHYDSIRERLIARINK